MKRKYHEVLAHIYEHEEVGIRDLAKSMLRKHGDHRDFYALAALLKEGYIGFTGPIHEDQWNQVKCFQCYSQGEGTQSYEGMTLFSKNSESYIYIGPKSITYFHERTEKRKLAIFAAILSLVVAVTSAVMVSKIVTAKPCAAITKQSS